MSISMYRASAPVLARGVEILGSLLQKGAAHAHEQDLPESTLIGARLFQNMMPLSGQVQFATDTARLSGERLSGIESLDSRTMKLRSRIAGTHGKVHKLPVDD